MRLPRIISVALVSLIIIAIGLFGPSALSETTRLPYSNSTRLNPLSTMATISDPVSGRWSPVGPTGMQYCQQLEVPSSIVNLAGGVCQGRVTSIALDPSHPGTVYVGGANGGVWKSINSGQSWTPLTENLQAPQAIGTITVNSTGAIYAGTGEGNCSGISLTQSKGAGACYYGDGILVSVDRGNSWTSLGVSTFAYGAISRILLDPLHSSTILVSLTSAESAASTGGTYLVHPSKNPLGIYVSNDAGNSWTNTLVASLGQNPDLAMDPLNPSTIYASSDGVVYKSTNNGATWQAFSNGLPQSSVNRITSASDHLFLLQPPPQYTQQSQ